MVNNVGGSNPNIYVDTRNQGNVANNQNVGQPQNKGYRPDGYAFNLNTPSETPVPDVKVGLFDKMGVTFKDVLNTTDNVKRFVAFENAMKANPEGYLKPGSDDVTKNTDLQKKLKLLGSNITINGDFGKATERAVINFKNSVGINDGYLNKDGNYAVSGIMTPQAWGVLNASVAARMNPNASVKTGNYTPPVTKQEMQWAKELQNKIANFGYKPSPAERTKYEDVYQRQRLTMQVNTGYFDPTQVSKPTETEMAWAKNMANKMSQFGYKPTDTEKQKYQDIYQRTQVTKSIPVQTPVKTQQTSQNQVTQADADWAVNLMNKVKGGYNPTPAESAKYEKIYSILQGNDVKKKQEVDNSAPPSQNELQWASQLEAKVSQGYNPTAQEKSKYESIFARYKANPAKSEDSTPKTGKPSDKEVEWAQALQQKVNNEGYQPSQAEIDKYTDIANRLNASESATTQEVKTESTKPSTEVNTSNDPFHGRTVEKFGKVGSAANDWAKKHPGQSFPRENVFYPDQNGQLVSQTMLNAAAKQGGNYLSNLGIKNAAAIYVPGLNSSNAANYSYLNGHIYNNSSLENGTAPKVVNNDAPVSKPKPKTQSAPVQQTQETASNVSQEELEWAQALQDKTAQGYQPTQQEIAMYTDIYKRSQSGSTPVVQSQNTQVQSNQQTTNTPAATAQSQNITVDASNGDPELKWALELLDKVQQGYQPNEQELNAYEQIIAKNQLVQATP